jgi:hypothetical protein
MIYPWVGYTPPARPAIAPPQPKPAASLCKDIAFVGLRGSGEAPQGAQLDALTSEELDQRLFGSFVSQVYGEYDKLETRSMKPIGVAYPALPVPWPAQISRFVTVNQFADSAYDGVDKLHEILLDEHTKCPSEKFILAGYSQGALAIHETLRLIPPTSALSSRIIGVALLADAGRVEMASEDTYTDTTSGLTIIARSGIWAKYMFGSTSTTGPIPDWTMPKTVAMCHLKDLVCANGWGTSVNEHLNYSNVEMTFFAQKLSNITRF